MAGRAGIADCFSAFSWPGVLLFLSFLLLIYLNAEGFSLWYFGEDFGWMQWTSGRDFAAVMSPPPASYYRPLAANIPYFFFGRLENGIFWWRAFSFFLVCFTGFLFWKWTRELAGNSWVALALTCVWLFNPSQAYGMIYLNALDYILTLFFLVAVLRALQLRKFGLAYGVFFAALFAKELLLGIPAFFFLWRRRYKIPTRWLVLSGLTTAALMLVLKGYSLKAATVGGFEVVTAANGFWQHVTYLIRDAFWGFGGMRGVALWFPLAWVTVGICFFAKWWKGRKEPTYLLHLAALIIFFAPLTLLRQVISEDLGPIYWIFLFGAAASAMGTVPESILPKAKAVLSLLLVFCAWAYSFGADGYRQRYVGMSDNYYQIVQKTIPLLSGCGRFDRVLLLGLENVFTSEIFQEYAAQGLRVMQPEAKFYILQLPGPRSQISIRDNGYLWAQDWQAEGHPRLNYRRNADGKIAVEWAQGSPPCRTSAESMPPRKI